LGGFRLLTCLLNVIKTKKEKLSPDFRKLKITQEFLTTQNQQRKTSFLGLLTHDQQVELVNWSKTKFKTQKYGLQSLKKSWNIGQLKNNKYILFRQIYEQTLEYSEHSQTNDFPIKHCFVLQARNS